MLVLLSWLNEYLDKKVDIRDEKEVKNLVNVMDNLGLVVESVEEAGNSLEGVVLARVDEIHPIEKKDKIRQVFLNAGPGMERVEVVCGAWNFTAGDIVPLATVGTRLPGDFWIETRRLGGVVSNGMLCSKRELALGDDHLGIDVVFSAERRELPVGMELGMGYGKYFGIEKDVLFDVAVEPNRPDALCVYGIARDIAPHIGAQLLPLPVFEGLEESPVRRRISVAIADDKMCDHFAFWAIENVTVSPSARKVAYRLSLLGMRSINSVVDATNYAMLELGRPSHAYDMSYLSSARADIAKSPAFNDSDEVSLVVRLARDGESLVTLDGNTRRFESQGQAQDPCNLVIAKQDGEVLALAGVMGGKASEVTEATGSVLLEIADFDPKAVLRTSRFHQLRSEASLRFERGIDPAVTSLVAERIYSLLRETALQYNLALPLAGSAGVAGDDIHREKKTLSVSLDALSKILGKKFTSAEVESLLSPVGFVVSPSQDGKKLLIEIPTFRPDVKIEADIAEEIARHFGYENFGKSLPRSKGVGRLRPYQANVRLAKQVLTGLGISEAWTNPLVDKNSYPLSKDRLILLANPLTSEENSLRTSMLPGLVNAVKRNVSYRNPHLRLFEVGRVFAKTPPGAGATGEAKKTNPAKSIRVEDYASEREELCCILALADDDSRQAYRVFEVLLNRLRIDDFSFELSALEDLSGDIDSNFMHISRSRGITLSGGGQAGRDFIGMVGELSPDFLHSLNITGRRIGVLTVDLEKLFSLNKKPADSRPVSVYPSSDIDLCFVAGYHVSARDIEKVLREAGSDYLESLQLIDSYAEQNGQSRSLTFRLRLADIGGTLDDKQIGHIWQECVDTVADRLNIGLRTA